MKLVLKRIALRDSYTIGKLYIDGEYFCDTCEGKVRDLNRDGDLTDCGESKVYGKTAIPFGEYEVTVRVKSPKFSQKTAYNWCGGFLPRLLGVKHFDGILIHAGNSANDSAGCIIVGKNKVVGQVLESMDTLKKLYRVLTSASNRGEKIWISIE